nr:hypothetical protein [Tanacetum cinerariifolium]
SGRIVPLFDTMLIQQGEGSGTPTEPQHTPSPEDTSSHHTTSSIPLPSFPTAPIPIPTVTQTDTTPIIQYSRRARIAQSSALLTVADEPASPVRDDNQGEACPTDSGFIADQDRETIAKSSTLPRDLAPRVTSPAAEEGSMQQTLNELTAFCTSLQRQHSKLLAKFQAQEVEINRLKERVKNLKDKEGVIGDKSIDDAPIKGRSSNEREAAAKGVSNDSEEIARVLTSLDVANVLVGETNVPTGSGSIPTTGPPATIVSTGSEVGPTASPIDKATIAKSSTLHYDSAPRVTSPVADKGREAATERISDDTEEMATVLTSIDAVTNFRLRRKGKEVMVESDTPKKQRLQEQIDAQVKDFKGMTFEEVEAKFNSVYKQMEDFIPMGSKEEAKRYKRKAIRFDQESLKKLKSSEEVIEEAKSTDEIPEEKKKK